MWNSGKPMFRNPLPQSAMTDAPRRMQQPGRLEQRVPKNRLEVAQPLACCAPETLILLLAVRCDVINSLLNRRDFLGFFVGDFGFEFVFECHHELDHIERIGTEVVKEGRLVLDLGFVNAKLFSDDLLDALFDAFHADLQVGKIPANYSQTKELLVLAMTKKTALPDMSSFA